MALRDLLTLGLGPDAGEGVAPTAEQIADAVWNEARAGHVAAGSFGAVTEWASTGGLDAAGVRTAIGMAAANLDTQLGTLATSAELATDAEIATAAAAAILATPANKLDTDASGYVSISGTKNTLDDLSGTDGDTLKTLSDQIDGVGGAAGSGAITWVYTLTNSIDATAIPDAEVWVTSDAGGLTVLASGRTNASGQVTFYLDAGTVYVWRQKAGWNFTNPDSEVVV